MVDWPETAASWASSQRVDKRFCAPLLRLAAFIGGKAANVGFDGIECGDADQGLSVSGVFPPSCSERHSSEDANQLMASDRIYGRPYS